MTAAPQRHQVESCAIRVAPDGDGFVMELADDRHEVVRFEFPGWIVHQLMRVLPHLDAALQNGDPAGPASLIAYPVADWRLDSAGRGQGLALHLRNDRQVDAAFQLSTDVAAALQRELGRALAAAAEPAPSVN